MTDEYADNERVWGRWQPRMLEPHECAEAFAQLMARPTDELRNGMFELMVDSRTEEGPRGAEAPHEGPVPIDVTWKRVEIDVQEQALDWSASSPLQF